jgi:sucrose-phosphate synthase
MSRRVGNSQADPRRILLISVHGLIRGENLELGRDADTGGQTRYVVELAMSLAMHPQVEEVDLVTRLVLDNAVSAAYAVPVENLASNARIVRIEAGPEGYIQKEELWDHLDSFADNLFSWMQKQPRWPDLLHSHYADSGYVGVRLSRMTGLPLIHTGHSLGRDKYRRLLSMGLTTDQIQENYHLSRRIDAEEDILTHASLVITSTRNEIENQYELYDCYTPEKMVVIPPGTDLQQFHPPKDAKSLWATRFAANLRAFLKEPEKPMILALSRPDLRKNIVGLMEAYGQSDQLQELANLVIVAGNRDDIRELNDGPQAILTELLLTLDCHDLYGKVALPKHHTADEVSTIYQLAAASKGVFINPALTEPFGLTLLEAAASGLPLVATENGGPVDIIANCQNGFLVDPLNQEAITEALISILSSDKLWITLSQNGARYVADHYSWSAHAHAYLKRVQALSPAGKPHPQRPASSKRRQLHSRAIISAIDNTLLGDPGGLERFCRLIREKRKDCLFGIATGRRLDAVLAIIKTFNIPMPDILITSLGTEICYPPHLAGDLAWTNHINRLWTPQVLRRIISELPGVVMQARKEQGRFKISCLYDGTVAPTMDEILSLLRQQEQAVSVTLSFGQYLDFVPARASKGQALRYVSSQWSIPLNQMLVAGGSSGDEDMLRGNTLGVVVANRHCQELSVLGDTEDVYYADNSHALGILEAIDHYDFFNR